MIKSFICPDCQKQVDGVIKSSLTDPIAYYTCPLCGRIITVANLKEEEIISYLNERVSSYDEKSVESMMYEPTKIDKEGQDYDMQPRSKR